MGYFREATFLVINSVIHNNPFPYNSVYLKPPDFLYALSTQQLLNLKWFLTLAFSLLFMGITLGLVQFYFNSKKFNYLTVLVYCLLIGISAIITFIGLMLGNFETVYSISRFVVGLAQSPLTSLVLFVLFYFKYKTENPVSNKIL